MLARATCAAARVTCSTIRKSVPSGRCGPCCSVAPTGRTSQRAGGAPGGFPAIDLVQEEPGVDRRAHSTSRCNTFHPCHSHATVVSRTVTHDTITTSRLTTRSNSQRRQKFPIAAGALFGGAHTGEDVLLDHRPAIVAMLIQPAHDRLEVDATLAQLGEDARPQRLQVVPAPRHVSAAPAPGRCP